jgi:hypothetical protein
MKVILLSLLATLADPQGPRWMDDYGAALEAARAARQPLLVVLDDSAPSDETLRPVSNRGVAPLLKPFVLCRIDVSTPYGQQVAAAFRAKSFPNFAVIDKTGSRILARHQGELSESDWTTLLTAHETDLLRSLSPPMIGIPQQCFT